MTETQYIDIDDGHDAWRGFWYTGDFIHTALFMRLVRARFAAALIPYQGLDEQTVLFSDAYFYSITSFLLYPLSNELWMTKQL